MATVLVSFIGIGEFKGKEKEDTSSTGYREVSYKFNENFQHKTTIFGSALLKYLVQQKRETVDTWLIMGTPQSIWCDLVQMFDDYKDWLKDEEIKKQYDYFNREAAKDRDHNGTPRSHISQENLDKWSKILTEKLTSTKVVCKDAGDATGENSQNKIFTALLENIKYKDKVVFDVTHGLRIQPIITSFVIMYLRYLRDIKEVDFYYGGKDLRGEVYKLDFCNQLLQATEAVAIYEQTGNYEQIGKNLGLSDNFNTNLEKMSFLDEVNRANTNIPNLLNTEITKATFLPLQNSLSDRFKSPLHWAGKATLANQLREKADFAFKRKQYFKAVLILTEAVTVAYGENCGEFTISSNLELYSNRQKAKKQMLGEEQGVPTGFNSSELQIFKNLNKLRNAIAHGTDSNGVEIEAVIARESVDDENKLIQVFNDGNNLFSKIIGGNIGG